MQNFQDIPDELLLGISAPTLVIAGDREAIKPEHAVEVARLIPDSRLLILPAAHGDYLGEAIMTPEGSTYFEVTARLVEDFLAS
jgi:pimeloyl-ACP methyl ester carboxylesterase